MAAVENKIISLVKMFSSLPADIYFLWLPCGNISESIVDAKRLSISIDVHSDQNFHENMMFNRPR